MIVGIHGRVVYSRRSGIYNWRVPLGFLWPSNVGGDGGGMCMCMYRCVVVYKMRNDLSLNVSLFFSIGLLL